MNGIDMSEHAHSSSMSSSILSQQDVRYSTGSSAVQQIPVFEDDTPSPKSRCGCCDGERVFLVWEQLVSWCSWIWPSAAIFCVTKHLEVWVQRLDKWWKIVFLRWWFRLTKLLGAYLYHPMRRKMFDPFYRGAQSLCQPLWQWLILWFSSTDTTSTRSHDDDEISCTWLQRLLIEACSGLMNWVLIPVVHLVLAVLSCLCTAVLLPLWHGVILPVWNLAHQGYQLCRAWWIWRRQVSSKTNGRKRAAVVAHCVHHPWRGVAVSLRGARMMELPPGYQYDRSDSSSASGPSSSKASSKKKPTCCFVVDDSKTWTWEWTNTLPEACNVVYRTEQRVIGPGRLIRPRPAPGPGASATYPAVEQRTGPKFRLGALSVTPHRALAAWDVFTAEEAERWGGSGVILVETSFIPCSQKDIKSHADAERLREQHEADAGDKKGQTDPDDFYGYGPVVLAERTNETVSFCFLVTSSGFYRKQVMLQDLLQQNIGVTRLVSLVGDYVFAVALF